MCNRPVEIVALPAVLISIIAISSYILTQKNWLSAYSNTGDTDHPFATLSPFYICVQDDLPPTSDPGVRVHMHDDDVVHSRNTRHQDMSTQFLSDVMREDDVYGIAIYDDTADNDSVITTSDDVIDTGVYDVIDWDNVPSDVTTTTAADYDGVPNADDAPEFVCFWMSSWDSTGFDYLCTVQHLCYWNIACYALCCLLVILSCIDRRSRIVCTHLFSKPAILLLAASAGLSSAVAAILCTAQYSKLNDLQPHGISSTPATTTTSGSTVTNDLGSRSPYRIEYELPFHLHLCSISLTLLALILALLHETNSRHVGSRDESNVSKSRDRSTTETTTSEGTGQRASDVSTLALDSAQIEEYHDLL